MAYSDIEGCGSIVRLTNLQKTTSCCPCASYSRRRLISGTASEVFEQISTSATPSSVGTAISWQGARFQRHTIRRISDCHRIGSDRARATKRLQRSRVEIPKTRRRNVIAKQPVAPPRRGRSLFLNRSALSQQAGPAAKSRAYPS